MERIASEKPDVILLDWLLPLMDGGEVLQKLGAETDTAGIAIIVISGQPEPEHVDPRIQCWLMKPVSVDDLVAHIMDTPHPPADERRVS
jgi:CheY-like chemotaxis protein